MQLFFGRGGFFSVISGYGGMIQVFQGKATERNPKELPIPKQPIPPLLTGHRSNGTPKQNKTTIRFQFRSDIYEKTYSLHFAGHEHGIFHGRLCGFQRFHHRRFFC